MIITVLLLGFLFTAIAYLLFPIAYRVRNGRVNSKKGRKIALWNSIICEAIFTIIEIATVGPSSYMFTQGVFYYFIATGILIDKNLDSDNEEIEENQQSQTSTKEKTLNTIQQSFQQNKHISTESYIFCEKCGHKIYASEKNCQNCGYIPNRASTITQTQPQPKIENIKQVENTQSVNSIPSRNIPFTTCPQCQSKIYEDEKNCLHCGYIVKQDNTDTTENFTNVKKSVMYTGNIDNIQQQTNIEEPTLSSSNINNRDKSKSIELFNSKGYDLKNSNTNFASTSTKYMGYWINPNPLQLSKNWYIVLNDCRNKKLYLFNIPKNSIDPQQLKHRENSKLQILIRENDLKFEDVHSGFCFLPYLKDTLEYDKIPQ